MLTTFAKTSFLAELEPGRSCEMVVDSAVEEVSD
jgi:hypothetical protein